jgi:hypothetical protein
MRLIAISDTQGRHNGIEGLPDGDILVHAGDFMNSGYDQKDIWSFNRWLGEQAFKRGREEAQAAYIRSRCHSLRECCIPQRPVQAYGAGQHNTHR